MQDQWLQEWLDNNLNKFWPKAKTTGWSVVKDINWLTNHEDFKAILNKDIFISVGYNSDVLPKEQRKAFDKWVNEAAINHLLREMKSRNYKCIHDTDCWNNELHSVLLQFRSNNDL